MRAPFTLENIIWEGICSRSFADLESVIGEDSVLLVGDRCMRGAEIIDFITEWKLTAYTVDNMEVVSTEQNTVRTRYHIRLRGTCKDGTELDTDYRVNSTWLGTEDENNTVTEHLVQMRLTEESRVSERG